MEINKTRSNLWYVLPILLHIIGGLISYYAIKGDDPKMAKKCLRIGIGMLAIQFGIGVLFGAYSVI